MSKEICSPSGSASALVFHSFTCSLRYTLMSAEDKRRQRWRRIKRNQSNYNKEIIELEMGILSMWICGEPILMAEDVCVVVSSSR